MRHIGWKLRPVPIGGLDLFGSFPRSRGKAGHFGWLRQTAANGERENCRWLEPLLVTQVEFT